MKKNLKNLTLANAITSRMYEKKIKKLNQEEWDDYCKELYGKEDFINPEDTEDIDDMEEIDDIEEFEERQKKRAKDEQKD
jgi:hypothetical protein